MAPPPSPLPRRASSPSPFVPSSPSSQAPSTIEDPTFSDISSLDDEDYELVDGRNSTALDATTSDLSTSINAVSPTWMAESAQSCWSHGGSVTTSPTIRDRQDSKATTMQDSFAHFDSEPGNDDSLLVSTLLKPHEEPMTTSSRYLNTSVETMGRVNLQDADENPPSGSSNGASAMSSNWVLPDPNSPANSAHLSSQPEVSTPSVSNITGLATETSGLQDSRLSPLIAPWWKHGLGASWGDTFSSNASSSNPRLSDDGAPLVMPSTSHPHDTVAVQEALAVAKKIQHATEPDWAQKTRAWLQLNNHDANDEQIAARKLSSYSGESEVRGSAIEQSSSRLDDGLTGGLRKCSRAAQRRIKTQFPDARTRAAWLHWVFAAFCGFMGAVVLMRPSMPVEVIRGAMTLSSGASIHTLLDASSASPSSVSIDVFSTVQVSQPVQTKTTIAAHSPGSYDLLPLVDGPKSVSVYRAPEEGTAQPFIDEDEPLNWGDSSENVTAKGSSFSDWAFRAATAAYYISRSSGKAFWASVYADWQYWKEKLIWFWSEVMEPAMRRFMADVHVFMSDWASDFSDATSFATAYGQAAAAAANRQTQCFLFRSKALEQTVMQEAGPLYDKYFKGGLDNLQERASLRLEQIAKAADTLRKVGHERATQALRSAALPLDGWSKSRFDKWSQAASREAKRLGKAGKVVVSKSSDAMSEFAGQMMGNLARSQEFDSRRDAARLESEDSHKMVVDATRVAAKDAVKTRRKSQETPQRRTPVGPQKGPNVEAKSLEQEARRVALRAQRLAFEIALKAEQATSTLFERLSSYPGTRPQQQPKQKEKEGMHFADRWGTPDAWLPFAAGVKAKGRTSSTERTSTWDEAWPEYVGDVKQSLKRNLGSLKTRVKKATKRSLAEGGRAYKKTKQGGYRVRG